ncbi:GFA family protein [Rhizobium terrae]|uniref:GFA family protein n=1 Tax=Rhizobium terrae TaxID=2171756 RepID=UPI000E3E6B89|nr:GFA family protein [Rhizobium terrae]
MHITGGCHCGQITYQAELDPQRVAICHCTDCQKLTGSPFRVTAVVSDDDLKIIGEPRIYKRVAESGRVRQQYFCPNCGSQLFVNGESGEASKIWGIRWGSIDQRLDIRPQRQVWCRSSPAWLSEIGELPAKDRD